MDAEREALIKEILHEIKALPEDKRVEVWNIVRYFSLRREAAQHD